MGIVFFQAVLATGTIASLFIAVLGFFNKPNQYREAKANAKKMEKRSKPIIVIFVAFFSVYLRQFILVILAISLGVAFALIAVFVHPPGIVATPTPTPAATAPVIITAPTKRTVNDAWLDELDPILPREEAFCWYQWSTFDPIQVKKTSFQHSIGVSIPLDELNAYYNTLQREIIHSEYIEYLLSYNYDTFQFDYGIDDLSFPDGIETACMCEYKIVVQSCNSIEYLGENDNIIFKTDWLNYRSILFRSTLMDVSNCESIRITVYWKFNMRQDGPSAFNIAILNPILRIEKTDTLVSLPPIETTKPDSIR